MIIRRINKPQRRGVFNSGTVKILLATAIGMVAAVILIMAIRDFEVPQLFYPTYEYEPEYIPEPPPPTPALPDPFDDMPAYEIYLPQDLFFYHEQGGQTELPAIGATGWAATYTPVRESASLHSNTAFTMTPGDAFIIEAADGYFWRIATPTGQGGWVDNRRVFINLPDVLPSIVFYVTNATASILTSSGYALPGVTGYALYAAHGYNPRLSRYEYIVPALYSFARALHTAQQEALANYDTLIIYEAFRPYAVQLQIVSALEALLAENETAHAAIENSPWNMGWFVSTGVSNHQRGAAVDANIGRVRATEVHQSGEFSFITVTDFTRAAAGAPMHELSPAAAVVDAPRSITVGQVLGGNVNWSGAATAGVQRMQRYFAAAGMHPLASEWWHFDYTPGVLAANTAGITGSFFTHSIYSIQPTIPSEG
jgi:D-alanyl-D-alanine dipeptidase